MPEPETTVTAAHTPAPWAFTLDDDGESCVVGFVFRLGPKDGPGWQSQRTFEYQVPSWEESPEQFAEAEANARLISAAPDLLDALRRVLEYMPSVTAFQREQIRLAEAAIAKAEA